MMLYNRQIDGGDRCVIDRQAVSASLCRRRFQPARSSAGDLVNLNQGVAHLRAIASRAWQQGSEDEFPKGKFVEAVRRWQHRRQLGRTLILPKCATSPLGSDLTVPD